MIFQTYFQSQLLFSLHPFQWDYAMGLWWSWLICNILHHKVTSTSWWMFLIVSSPYVKNSLCGTKFYRFWKMKMIVHPSSSYYTWISSLLCMEKVPLVVSHLLVLQCLTTGNVFSIPIAFAFLQCSINGIIHSLLDLASFT